MKLPYRSTPGPNSRVRAMSSLRASVENTERSF
jgi:hypothetical protein